MNAFDYYVSAFKNYADFSGRARRSAYWYFVLFNILFSIGANIVDAVLGTIFVGVAYALVAFIPGLALSIRRLHDTTRSGWWLLIALVPIIGFIVLLVFFVEDSHPANEYGPNPKDPVAVGEDDISRHLVD